VLVTVLLFVVFIGIVIWVMAPRNKRRFDAAEKLPFRDETPAPRSPAVEKKRDE
jgi:cbb3-type cytochrome oxidase subunit 3